MFSKLFFLYWSLPHNKSNIYATSALVWLVPGPPTTNQQPNNNQPAANNQQSKHKYHIHVLVWPNKGQTYVHVHVLVWLGPCPGTSLMAGALAQAQALCCKWQSFWRKEGQKKKNERKQHTQGKHTYQTHVLVWLGQATATSTATINMWKGQLVILPVLFVFCLPHVYNIFELCQSGTPFPWEHMFSTAFVLWLDLAPEQVRYIIWLCLGLVGLCLTQAKHTTNNQHTTNNHLDPITFYLLPINFY